jgi:hypothetical protein
VDCSFHLGCGRRLAIADTQEESLLERIGDVSSPLRHASAVKFPTQSLRAAMFGASFLEGAHPRRQQGG